MKRKFIFNIILLLLGMLLGICVTYLFFTEKKKSVEVSSSIIIDRMEVLGDLEIVKYNVQNILEYKKSRQWLPNSKTALLVNGEIIICIRLSEILEKHIKITADSILIVLPPPTICHVRVNHSKSKVYDMTYGLWETVKLMDEAYKYAEKEIKAQAYLINYKSEALENTKIILTPMLAGMGFNHIELIYEDAFIINNK